MTVLGVLMPGFTGPVLPGWLEERLRDGLGGVCLFATNIDTPSQVREMTDQIHAANPDALIAIDEEGGDVSRLYQREGSPFPGNAVLGRLDDADLTRRVGEQVGRELLDVGIDLALAPDADVNSNPANPVIGVRSFGAEPDLVARHTVAWLEGMQSTGVAANAKHFPGHGDTSQDSHLALPVIDVDLDTLHSRELAPFVAAIAAEVWTIMTSHIVVPVLDTEYPATMSAAILTQLLRDTLGFTGLVVSDAMDMVGASGRLGLSRASAAAVSAGCDLLCLGTDTTPDALDEVVAAVTAGVTPARLADADARRAMVLQQIRATRASGVEGPLTPGRIDGLGSRTVQCAFHVGDHAAAALATRGDQPVRWVQVRTAPNIAVGESPWGPFATGRATADAVITAGGGLPVPAASDRLTVVVGKDLHRHPWACDAIDGLRSDSVIVVDMGWPDLTAPYADIATFGASRLVGDALVDLVGGV